MKTTRGRWARRLVAGLALATAAADLARSTHGHHLRQPGPLGIGYVVDAIVGSRFVLVLAALTLVLASRSILAGKKSAWWLAVVAAAASLPAHPSRPPDRLGLGLAALLLVALVAARRQFVARHDPVFARQGWFILIAGELTVFLYGAIGLSYLDSHFQGGTSVADAVTDTARFLFLLPASRVEPVTRHGSVFLDSVRFAALAVVLISLARFVATRIQRGERRAHDVDHVTELLRSEATSPLARFQLLDDKSWWFSLDRQAFVGYKLVGTTALALAEPVGAPDSQAGAAEEFLAMCERNGWTPAFHQVSPGGRAVLEAAGLHTMKIGEEALVEFAEWDLDDRRHKSLRSALRRVERAGCRVVELGPVIDDATMRQLHEVSDDWLASGNHRERTFTLGRFDPGYLRDTTVLAVVSGDDDAPGGPRIEAFVNLLPSYRSEYGNFDLMRRRTESPNGVMEFLFVAMIDRFRAEGRRGMTLGFAPLANLDGDSLTDRALRTIYERGGKAFNFSGLRAFKDKWGPRWEPRYLAYRTESELPRVALAVSRAGELPDPRSPLTRAAAFVRPYPLTASVLGVVLWLMLVGARDQTVWARLADHYQLAWPDLAHFQWWRIATAPLIQTKPGFRFWNVVTLVIVLPLSERRFGTRITAALFALGDWCSTVPILVGMRILGALGSHRAMFDAVHRDGGSSAAGWAVLCGLLLSIENRTIRRVGLGLGVGFHLGAFVLLHRLVDVQHLGAMGIGAVIVTRAGLCAEPFVRLPRFRGRRPALTSP